MHPAFCDELCTSPEVRDRRPRFALLPVGALEQHGAHLPLATDTLVAAALGRRVAEELGGMLLPAIPYGTSREHRGFSGTISLDWRTLAALVTDVVTGCWEAGIEPVFVLSGHGGNFVLNPCLRELTARHGEGRVVLVPESLVLGTSSLEDLHAGSSETSLALAIAPETVRLEQALDEIPTATRAELSNRPFQAISHSGVWGRPTLATREDGLRLLEERVAQLRGYVAGWLDAGQDLGGRTMNTNGYTTGPTTGRRSREDFMRDPATPTEREPYGSPSTDESA